MRKIASIFFIIVAGICTVHSQDKPLVYNHITKGTEALDRQVAAALADKFHVVDIAEDADYQLAKVTAGSLPSEALDKNGEKLSGYVLLAYVIAVEGNATSPVILKSTNEAVNSAALNAVRSWRFTPATYQGKPVSTVAAQEFTFKNAPSGFEVSNVVLYQPNDVLVARMPGVENLAQYIKQLTAILTSYFKDNQTPENIDVVVGLRPGKLAKVWFVSTTRMGNTKEFNELRKQLEAVQPVEVKDQVAFAISGKISGGDPKAPKKKEPFEPPIPQEWDEALKGKNNPQPLPDAAMNAAWPRG